ncbi:MAG: hypothetical protein COA94_08445 [Rickettsiales bacterium]|nr:MAG: hypothetical protein COA94_08445 [Rickettsiales bacterium]
MTTVQIITVELVTYINYTAHGTIDFFECALDAQLALPHSTTEVCLNSSISRFDSLLNLLEDVDTKWYEKVRSLWFDLDIIIAMQDGNVFSKTDLTEINQTVQELKNLVEDKVKIIPEDYML